MATVVDQNVTFRLASSEPSGIFVPKSLLELYQPRIGPVAVSFWLNLRWMAVSGHTLPSDDWIPSMCNQMRTTPMQLLEAMDALLVYELLHVKEDREYIILEPLGGRAFLDRFGDTEAGSERPVEGAKTTAALERVGKAGSDDVDADADGVAVGGKAADETAAVQEDDPARPKKAKTRGAASVERRIVWDGPGAQAGGGGLQRSVPDDQEDGPQAVQPPPDASPDPESRDAREADLSAVMGMYHKKIGMIGPTQFEKLRWWVDEQSMDAEVIALAIEETAKNAEMPTIQYLESVLRNWHNAGVRTFEDLLKRQNLSRSLRRSSLSASVGGDRDGRSQPDGRSSGESRDREARYEGMANAAAYQEADPARLRRWKELYADEQ